MTSREWSLLGLALFVASGVGACLLLVLVSTAMVW